jgi:gluconolactonase
MPHRRAFTVIVLLAACGQAAPGHAPDAGGTEAGSGGSQPEGTGGGTGGSGASSGTIMIDASPPDARAPDPDAASGAPPDAARGAAAPRCPPGPYEAPKVGASKTICAGFAVKYDWNEGPTWVAKQKAFFFSNFLMNAPGPGDMIKYDPATDKCEFFIEGNGCNGLAADNDGDAIIATCQTPRAVLRFDLATKTSTVLADMVQGQKLDSPNDLAIHSNGTIYFSNTTLELAGRDRGFGPALLFIDPAGMVHVVAQGSINPLGLSPDQKRLYAMGGYWDLDDNGVPTKKNNGFTLGGDGLAIDCAGNV